jgi:type I restriction enzyme M protein
MLFIQHMISKMRAEGARLAIVFNGSPLFTGGAESGESEIRRWIIENDWLEGIVAMPTEMFYNTGIATYIWVLTNRKAPGRKGKVQLIDASAFWKPMRKSLGDKRREIPLEKAADVLALLASFKDGETRQVAADGEAEDVVVSKVFPTTHFGFRKITVERSLRLNFSATPARIARLEDERGFQGLAQSKKKGVAGVKEQDEGRAEQEAIRKMLGSIPPTLFKARTEFEKAVRAAAKKAGLELATPVLKAILSALSERDESASICLDKDGNPESDPDLRDSESVPLAESVAAFFEREVKPHVPDAWIDEERRDTKDGQVGVVGYEINFNRYFYRYKPPRPLEAIEAEIRKIEKDIVRMLGEVTGGVPGRS